MNVVENPDFETNEKENLDFEAEDSVELYD